MKNRIKKIKSSKRFQAVRSSHKTEAAEDYTELIADLIAEEGEARICGVAKKLGITHVTALRTVKRLEQEGYLKTKPYSPIKLTASGRALAERSKKRHKIVLAFLLKIGVPPELAEIDSEGIEHHISDRTLRILNQYISR
jgi:DtxR family manganese transport transcriptional regulator